jgi:tetratricopeptide (TPR) repeat protein
METNLPSGARVGVERGGFTMLPLLRQDRFHPVVLNVSTLFEARGYMSCGAQFEYLRHDRLLDLDFITFIDVNRYAQYVAAPRLLPVAAGFYARLLQGNLGFERVGRFKNYPAVMGLEFGDDGAEASFIGYDHPAVYLFRRTNNREVETAMNRWRRDLTANAACPDELLGAAALALRQQRLSTVDEVTRTAATRFPGLRLLHLINAEANRRRGRPYARELDLFVAGFRNRATHVLPWASAMSFAVLDLPELALSVLRQFGSARHYPSHYHRDLSQSYLILANLLYRRGELPVAGQVYQLAAALHPAPAASNRLAVIAYRGGRHAEAAAHWTKSLRLDASQAGIHANLGQILAKHLGTPERARYHLRRAVELDPMLEPELSGWIADLGPGEDLAAPLPPDRDPGADPPLRHRPRSARDDAVQ